MSLASQVTLLAQRIGQECKALHARIDALTATTDPWTYIVLNADVSNTTASAATVGNMSIATSGLPVGTYIFNIGVLHTSVDTTIGNRFGFTFPAAVALRAMMLIPLTAATNNIANINTTGSFSTSATAPVAAPGESWGIIDGIFKITATTTTPINFQMRSEAAGSEVKAIAGSYIRYRRIA